MRLLALVALVAACALPPRPTSTSGPQVTDTAAVVVDLPTHQLLTIFQLRLQGHKEYPDHEFVLCLYGVDARPRYVKVESIRATRVDSASAVAVWPQPCPIAPDYLGMWHSHFERDYNGDGVIEDACWFSSIDGKSFRADPLTILELVTCGGGRLLKRVKPR